MPVVVGYPVAPYPEHGRAGDNPKENARFIEDLKRR
jgi:hypothetical protein